MPTSKNELISEIKEICSKQEIIPALRAIRVATQEIVRRGNDAQYYILTLNFHTSRLTIKAYSSAEVELATKDYHAIENQKADSRINAVLVSANSIEELKRAYPNYFTDVEDFLLRVNGYLE